MIRGWTIRGNVRYVAFLRADLEAHIQKWKYESHFADHAWYDRLTLLVAAVKPDDYGSFDSVYEHMQKAKPRHVSF
jgi:hypothetical protein